MTVITNAISHHIDKFASDLDLMQYLIMRTTLKLDDDVHEFASVYATAKGLTLSAAVSELLRKAESAPSPKPEIVFSSDGFPMFPPSESGRIITSELIKKIEEEEFDPKKFT